MKLVIIGGTGLIGKHREASPRATTPAKLCLTHTRARYFGAERGECSLIPAGDARLGEVRFQEWLNQSAVQR